MTIAYFDPFSGASGDMILGALIDAGLPLRDLTRELGKLGLTGYDVRAEPASQHGIHGTRVSVDVKDDVHSRTWSDIRTLIDASELDTPIKSAATAVFQRLAGAEAKIHGTTPDHVHFHEVGGIDAIVDICGACIGLALLGVDDVYSGPPQAGSGFARSAHGIIPIPAPATLELLATAGAPLASPIPAMTDNPVELLTPTGAAILTTFATFTRPSLMPSAIGYGFGSKELPWPNALRVWIGELDAADTTDGEVQIECNLDDMNPQFYELLLERVREAGALDAWLTPIQMKKSRPATLLGVIAPAARQTAIEQVIIANSSTLGVRSWPVQRTKAARSIETVATRWGDVRIKLRAWDGRAMDAMPEYEDCLALARKHDLSVREIWNEAHRLGEAFLGRKV